jgi:hypothetical protein
MSSHREAPQISKDPTADSTDLYAFVSPDPAAAGTVTLIANYIPLERPDGGPNFYEFADDVLYAIHVDNDGDGDADISFEFRFSTVNTIPNSFLYNDGPITALTGPGAALWNRRQTYSLVRKDHRNGDRTELGTGLTVPPCNIGPLSTPMYSGLADQAVHNFTAGGYHGRTFAGQRAEGFYVDLGAVFDLGGLRPFEADHLSGMLANMPGVNSTAAVNVHSLALQMPIEQLTANRRFPSSTTDPNAVIGVWTTASRQKARVHDGDGHTSSSGPFTQLSRLGNPLVNEVIIGIGDKDRWNTSAPPADGTDFGPYFANPLLGQLLPALYASAVFPKLAAYNQAHATKNTLANPARPDLVAILLTGIPQSVLVAAGLGGAVPPTNVGGTGVADMLRLNTAQRASASPSIFGYLGGDPAGFPNGRRVFDDVATIEVRAIAGATLPLVAPSFTPDGAVGSVGTDTKTVISFGLTDGNDPTAFGTENYLASFPYLGVPYSGYGTPSQTPTDKAS